MVALKDLENETITRMIDELVEKLSTMNTDPYFREAIMRYAVREFSWSMLHAFRDKFALTEQLTLMGELVADHDLPEED